MDQSTPPHSMWNDEWKYRISDICPPKVDGVKWTIFAEMGEYSSIVVVRRRKQVFIQLSDPTSSIPISVTIFSRLSALWSMTSSLDNYLWIVNKYLCTMKLHLCEDRGSLFEASIALVSFIYPSFYCSSFKHHLDTCFYIKAFVILSITMNFR